MNDYCLLLTQQPRVDIPAVSRPLARLFRTPLLDVTTALRKAWGVLYEQGLPGEEAEQARAILEQAGQPAALLPVEQLVPRLRPRRITWADVGGEALAIGAVYETERHRLPWDALFCISVGLVHERPPEVDLRRSNEFRQMMQLDRPEERELLRERVARQVLQPDGEGVSTRRVELGEADEVDLAGLSDERPISYHLDLVLDDPWWALRISCADFCYSSLAGAGGSALCNFRLLLERIIAAAPRGARTPITEQFLDGQVPQASLFAEVEQFEAYTRWCCNRLVAAGQAPAPSEADFER